MHLSPPFSAFVQLKASMADERRSGPPFKGNVAEFWEEVEATSDKKRGEAVGPFPLNPQKRT